MTSLEEEIKLIKPVKKYPVYWLERMGHFARTQPQRIKAKIDTGARTSALHAFSLKPFIENGKKPDFFDIHPFNIHNEELITCTADIVDRRLVTDSGGHSEERYVIETPITIADKPWPIEITLTERENMLFRMLLGRSAYVSVLLLTQLDHSLQPGFQKNEDCHSLEET